MRMLFKTVALIAVSLSVSCININEPLIAAVYPKKMIVELKLSPPAVARSSDSRNTLVDPIAIRLVVPMLMSLGQPTANQPVKDTIMQDAFIGATIGIRQALFQYVDGMWLGTKSDASSVHVRILPGIAALSGGAQQTASVLSATLRLNVRNGDTLIATAVLQPVLSSSGLSYGANIAVPLGMSSYAFEIKASGFESTARDSGNQQRLRDPLSVIFSDRIVAEEPVAPQSIGDTLAGDSLRAVLMISRPETLWVWSSAAGATVPTLPRAECTLYASATLKDLKSRSTGEPLAYVQAQCRMFSELGGDSTAWANLIPIQGSTGFYYGVNMLLPIVGGIGDDDGHGH